MSKENGVTRQDIIREYIGKHGADVEMLEIGVDYGDTWHHQRGLICTYTGVDISLATVTVPMNDPHSHWVEMDSREFWKQVQREGIPKWVHGTWNLIFIDGCHDYELAVTDMREALKWLAIGGYMLIHDVSAEGSGVRRAYEEVCLADPTLQCFIDDRETWGIAVCLKIS